MNEKTQFNIFISHIHEESDIAHVLKKWLEACFPKLVTVFVSSDFEDVPLGQKWLETIDAAMNNSRLVISIISPLSFDRMWIHLETGWARGREIEVLPICHSGVKASELRRPYSDYNGVEIEDLEFARRLLVALKKRLGLSHSLPEGMLKALGNEVRAVVARIKQQPKQLTSAEEKITSVFELTQAEVDLLGLLAIFHEKNIGMSPTMAAVELKCRPALADHHLKQLEKRRLVSAIHSSKGTSKYFLGDDGLAFLVEQNLL